MGACRYFTLTKDIQDELQQILQPHMWSQWVILKESQSNKHRRNISFMVA